MPLLKPTLTFDDVSLSFRLTFPDLATKKEHPRPSIATWEQLGGEKGLTFRTVSAKGAPCYLPFAALPWVEYADEAASARLAPLTTEYRASAALEDAGEPGWLPPGERLLPFQAAGVRYALRRANTLIADPMGLGKTVQALAFCNAVRASRILVVCPAAIVRQWREAACRWLVPFPGQQTNGVSLLTGANPHPTARVVVVSYDRAKTQTVAAALSASEWDVLILDEAHYLRNHTSQRSRAILGAWRRNAPPSGVAAHARHIIALTGTPLPNRPLEVYPLARVLDWESIDFMSFDSFKEAFNQYELIQITRKDGSVVFARSETVTRLEELQARLRCGFMVRREKTAAAPQLPEKIYDVVDVASNALESIVRRERLLEIDVEHLDTLTFEQQAAVASVRREMGLEMAEAARDIIEDMVESDGKIVVFCWHLDVVDRVCELFPQYKPVTIVGSHSAKSRGDAVRIFVEDPECRLFVANIQAGGTGIDGLQNAASSCVILEPSWVPGENEQAIDRLHRYGQRNPVLARFLVAEGSISARVIRRAVEKARVAFCALDNVAAPIAH